MRSQSVISNPKRRSEGRRYFASVNVCPASIQTPVTRWEQIAEARELGSIATNLKGLGYDG